MRNLWMMLWKTSPSPSWVVHPSQVSCFHGEDSESASLLILDLRLTSSVFLEDCCSEISEQAL